MRDSLAGVFLSTCTMEHLEHVSEWLERPLPSSGNLQRYSKLEAEIIEKTKKRDSVFSDVADPTPEMKAEKEQLKEEIEELEKQLTSIPTVMSVEEKERPQDVPVHIRGSHLQLAEQAVPRGPIRLFDDIIDRPRIANDESGRLQLAQWIVDPRNPLTARVMVNRIWQGHFGEGLVRTPSDFGLRGTPPTHPQLLDWLAERFVQSGWSIKAMHRLIMNSATYRMASSSRQPHLEKDPENRLLWRQNRRRLEVEPLRDALLAITGDLELKRGGSLEDTPADSKYARTTEEPYESQRRAIYLPVVRNRAYEMFAIFDYVDSGVHLAKRAATTVPHQTLFMMNNSLVLQQSKTLAKQLLEIDGFQSRIGHVYLRLFSRPPTTTERQWMRDYLNRFRREAFHLVATQATTNRTTRPAKLTSELETRPEDGDVRQEQADEETPVEVDGAEERSEQQPSREDAEGTEQANALGETDGSPSAEPDLAAWASLCRVLLGANEFIYVD